jgi:hypothetical protein
MEIEVPEYQEISGAAANKFAGFVGSHLVNNCPKNYVFINVLCVWLGNKIFTERTIQPL